MSRRMKGGPYSEAFISGVGEGSSRAAEVVVPLVHDLLSPRSVVDIGCGTGVWLMVFVRRGVEDVLGVDGPWAQEWELAIPNELFRAVELDRRFDLGRKFDLAISLEVAEHLPESSAENFVSSLTRLAPVILFSAAVPGQGGCSHVNEQWPTYWAELFAACSYVPIDALRPQIWADKRVPFYYRQNMIFFVARDALPKSPLANSVTSTLPLTLVHPELYERTVKLVEHLRRLPVMRARSLLARVKHRALRWLRRAG